MKFYLKVNYQIIIIYQKLKTTYINKISKIKDTMKILKEKEVRLSL